MRICRVLLICCLMVVMLPWVAVADAAVAGLRATEATQATASVVQAASSGPEAQTITVKPRPCRIAILTGMVCISDTVLHRSTVVADDRAGLASAFSSDILLPRGVAIPGQPAPPRAG